MSKQIEQVYRDTFLTPEEIVRDTKIREAVQKEFPPAVKADLKIEKLLVLALDSIAEIDRECNTVLNKVEHGLINVKLQFQEAARKETGKVLTEEPLVAWLMQKKFMSHGWHTQWECRYPAEVEKELGGGVRRCDLLVDLENKARLWLELKLASKGWFNCVGGPTYSNRNYLPYLRGENHTHSFWGDLKKLSGEGWRPNDYRAVCLIGFDCIRQPMDDEVSRVVQVANQNKARGSCVWNSIEKRHWKDRRNSDFRINTWCWLLQCSRNST